MSRWCLLTLTALSCTTGEDATSTGPERREPPEEEVPSAEPQPAPVPDGSLSPGDSASTPAGLESPTEPGAGGPLPADGGADPVAFGDASASGGPSLGGTVCEGYIPRSTEEPLCSSSADCAATEVCGESPPLDPCPPWNGDEECIGKTAGESCGGGGVCTTGGCPAPLLCRPVCSEENCNGTRHCVDGSCVNKPCDQGGSCSARYRCEPAASDGGGTCLPIVCDDDSPCPAFMECRPDAGDADEYGCIKSPCARDADCGCGFCIEGRCLPQQGVCADAPPRAAEP